MNDIPNPKQVERLQQRYPPGSRVRVDSVEDPYTTIPSGTEGTVFDVDCVGTVHCEFDNGQSLGLIPGVDSFQKIGDSSGDIFTLTTRKQDIGVASGVDETTLENGPGWLTTSARCS